MNQIKLNELLKTKTITIPLYVLKMYKEFNLSSDEIILFLFLYDKDNEAFNPTNIFENTGLEIGKILEGMSNLNKKGLINIELKTNSLGVKEEFINLSPFFDKVTIKAMDFLNKDNDNDDNIYNVIEEEFNRKLSPIECETIDDWKKNGYANDLIKEAVREAILNGANSLRYIDKILFEWNKKGYKNKEDVKKKNIKKETSKEVEIYTGDWLDSDEEL